MLRLISTADLVQRKGLALSFQWLSQFMMAASRRRTLSKLPRRIAWPVMIANQRSTRFSHDALLGGEVQMDAEMGGQPLVYGKMLVGSVVVANEMQLPFGVTARQRFQESNELNMGMAREAASMHLAAGDLQRCEQAGGAVAGVVVAHAGWQSRPHRQRRLGAVKRLNLRFFIHTQHQRSL